MRRTSKLPELKFLGEGNLNSSLFYQSDASCNERCSEPGEGPQISRRTPEEQRKGIPHNPAIKSASPGAELKGVCGSAHGVDNEKGGLRDMHTPPGMQSYWHDWRCGGMAPMTRVLYWRDTSSLGRTGRGDDEVLLSPVSMTSRSAWSSIWMRRWLRAYGSRLEGGQGQVTLQR